MRRAVNRFVLPNFVFLLAAATVVGCATQAGTEGNTNRASSGQDNQGQVEDAGQPPPVITILVSPTMAPEPTATATPSATATPPEPTPTPVPPSPTPTPRGPTQINGVPMDQIAVMDEETQDHVRAIFAKGQEMGRDPRTFSKLGDSLIATPHFLTQFDSGRYNLGDYGYLQEVIDYYAGSFARYGVAVLPGLHSWAVFDPLWADKDWCLPNESVLACEVRLNNPSILLVLLGTNDSGSPAGFNANLREVVEYCIENGIVPVLATKADRFEGPDNANNISIRQVAADYKVPLWEFDTFADTLPGRGLGDDNVHLSTYPEGDYSQPEALQRGYSAHNLTALVVLDAIHNLTLPLIKSPPAEPVPSTEGQEAATLVPGTATPGP